jgi:AcrR family transcriptional regulator
MKTSTNLHQKAAEKARAKILQAGRTLFLEYGFSGTSIGALAKLAGINQSLVYHYFENKEDLWRQVKADIVASAGISEEFTNPAHIKTLQDLLERLVTTRFRVYAANPDLIRMLMWQSLEDKRAALAGSSSSWTKSWENIILDLQNKKKITAKFTPQEIILMVNGIIWAPFVTSSTLELQKNGELFCAKMVHELTNFLKNET